MACLTNLVPSKFRRRLQRLRLGNENPARVFPAKKKAGDFAGQNILQSFADGRRTSNTQTQSRRTEAMRMLLQISIPVEAGNQAARKGAFGEAFGKILAELKPEAAYFTATEHGERGGFIVFDLKDSSQIPAIAEP